MGRLSVPFAIAAVTCLVFWPVVYFGYVDYDDYQLYLENFAVRSFDLKALFTSFAGGTYVPLTLLSAASQFALVGGDPSYFHFIDLLLHAGNAVVVYLISRRLGWDTKLSCAAALVFALHPLRVESVAWASARKDTLSGLLSLLAVLAYQISTDARQEVRRRRGAYLVAGLSFVLACFAKPSAVVVPLFWLAWDWYEGRLVERQAFIDKLPWLMVSCLFGLINFKAQETQAILTTQPDYLSAAMRAIPQSISFYLGKFAWPGELSILYPDSYFRGKPWLYGLAALVLALALSGLFDRTIFRRTSFYWLWFIPSLALVLRVIPFGSGDSWVNDRFLYLPSVGLAGACLCGFHSLAARLPTRGRRMLWGLAGLWLVGLVALCRQHLPVWQSTVTLWQQVQRTYPELPHSYRSLGNEALAQGHPQQAAQLLQQAYEREPLYGKRLDLLASLAISFSQSGDQQKALALFEKVLQEVPSFENKVNYGVTLFLAHRMDEARTILTQAMHEQPGDPRPPYNLALIALAEGKAAEAKALLQKALANDPGFAPAAAKLRSL